MRKSFKVKSEASRIALVEFLVEKRVRFLEYLRDLHRYEVLWMGTVRLTREDILRYFQNNNNNNNNSNENSSSRMEGEFTEYRLPSMDPIEINNSTNTNITGKKISSSTITEKSKEELDEVVVTVGPISNISQTVSSSWIPTRIPSYLCLAISLADIIRAPLAAIEFTECFYALLLELDVRFASGTTAKALAQRNLRNYRHHQQQQSFVDNFLSSSGGLSIGINNNNTNTSGTTNIVGGVNLPHTLWESENQVKYIYLNLEHQSYITVTEVRYDEVIIALCSQLILAYRRLGDYDVAGNEDCVKRILSIDRRLQQLFFTVISKEIGKIAHKKLLQQTLLLSTDGLFTGISETYSNTRILLHDLIGHSIGTTLPTSVKKTGPDYSNSTNTSNNINTSTSMGGSGDGGVSNINTGVSEILGVDSDEEFEEDEL